LNSIYSFELYVVLVQSEVFRDRLAKLSFKSDYETLRVACFPVGVQGLALNEREQRVADKPLVRVAFPLGRREGFTLRRQ
jgi:hypothetical protein